MVRAIWNGAVLADTDDTVVMEGNHYSQPRPSIASTSRRATTARCAGGRGQASYYDLIVNGKVNPAAAWYYPDPQPAAEAVRGRVAFWHGVRVEDDTAASEGLLATVRRLLRG